MIIKNTTEELVLNAVDEMLKGSKDEISKNPTFRNDVACYVLNRLKPMYVTSSRGVIHREIDNEKNVQEHVDVFALVAQAMKIVASRRQGEAIPDTKNTTEDIKNLGENLYFNFPYIIGKIMSTVNWEGMSGTSVTLKHTENEKYVVTPMINNQWTNPHIISKNTKGYYTFFPYPFKDEMDKKNTKPFDFMLLFEHPKFELIERYFQLEIESERTFLNEFREGYVYRIEDVFINVASER